MFTDVPADGDTVLSALALGECIENREITRPTTIVPSVMLRGLCFDFHCNNIGTWIWLLFIDICIEYHFLEKEYKEEHYEDVLNLKSHKNWNDIIQYSGKYLASVATKFN